MFDLIISGGTVIDGSGREPFTADVAILDGVVSAIGTQLGSARRTVDASGALVTPGFVDIHSHYDGQVVWGSTLEPSSWHGVTTTVFGNCGVGFAPVRRQDHDTLIALMEGVEDIPGTALHEGISWAWESFGEYLDAIDRNFDMDIAAQVPHGAVRLYVMGERATNGEPASPNDITEMAQIVAGAVRAGALGFTTSRTVNHRTAGGADTPTLRAAHDELLGIARAVGEVGRGVLELITDFDDVASDTGLIRQMAEVSGRPVSFSLQPKQSHPDLVSQLLGFLDESAAHDLPIRGQVAARAVGTLVGHTATMHPFENCPTARALKELPLDRRLEALRRSDTRSRILNEYAPPLSTPGQTVRRKLGKVRRRLLGRAEPFHRFDGMYVLTDPPNYEPDPSTSVGAEARRRGVNVDEFVYDLLLEEDGQRLLYVPIFNYTDNILDEARRLLVHDSTVMGLGDGGAHVGIICDASFQTTMLTHWARDRTRGEKLGLAFVIRQMTRATAEAVGLTDRGLLEVGMRADINVIDLDRLTAHAPYIVHDLPAGGARFLQRADGYLHTFVRGVETYTNGVATGALPGRLVRGGPLGT